MTAVAIRLRARAACRIALALSTAGLVACGPADDVDARLAARSPAAARLTGSWTVLLARDPLPSSPSAAPPAVTGTLTLAPDSSGRVVYRLLRHSTHDGVYDIDTGLLGFLPDVAQPVPVAVAQAIPLAGHGTPAGVGTCDSVVIVLSPDASRLAVRLDGRLCADSVAGRWRAEAFSPAGLAGTFRLRRRTPSS